MLLHDIRYALRLMRRSPGFTTVAVLSLALGIGANTSIYSLFYTVMWRPLAIAHPEQLVELVRQDPGEPRNDGYWGWEKYEYLRDRNHVFSVITGMSFDNLASIRLEGGEPEPLVAENVLGNYFTVLGLKPALGRLTGSDDVPPAGEADAVVVSWSYWTTRLHSDPQAIGRKIWWHDQPKTIVGVAPRNYTGPRVGVRTDVWRPFQNDQLSMLARLKPGVSPQQAQAELNVLYRVWLEQTGAKNKSTRVEVEPAAAGMTRVRDRYGNSLTLLLAVVGLLLLLACINMASMLVARSAGRQRELAVRVGLGAGRGRLVRQMLTESVLLSAAGTLAGLIVAYVGTGVLVRIMASGRAWEHVDIEVHPGWNLVFFTAGIAVLTGVLFGIAPAWHAFRTAPATALRQSGRAADTWFARWFGKALVALQVALSIFLVTAAAAFLDHVARLRNLDLGFQSDHVLMVTLDPTRSGYRRDQLAASYQELLARFQTIPSVRSASIAGCTPLEGCGAGARYVTAEGHVERPEDRVLSPIASVAPLYFETLGIPLLAGRDFSFRDAGRPRVAIVNQLLARRYFPGVDPIGKHFTIDRDSGLPYEIVGVVADSKAIELRDAPRPSIFFNTFQDSRVNHQFVLRTTGRPESVAGTVRAIVRDVLKGVPVKRVATLSGQVDSNIVPERLIATLSEYFGALGAVLAGIGLYGLLAYTVTRRTNEIGIRMALGATSRGVSWLVLRDVLAMVAAGLAAGALLILWARPLAARLLPELNLQNAVPLAIGAAAMAAVAILASYVPVRRAARVDPMVALRHE